MPPATIDSANHVAVEGALVVNCATVVSGSLPTDTIVQKHCSLHVRGNLIGSLTIEEGANVLVDGSIAGKIVNRGGRLVVHHKGLTEGVVMDGPSADEADAVLKINLTAVAFNWATLAKNTDADCAAVLECNAYGCGIDPVADALAKSGCRTFFVTNLAEARRVRAAAHLRFPRAARRRLCKAQCATRHQQRNRARCMGCFRQRERMAGRLCADRRHRREQARTDEGGGGPAFREGALFESRHHAP